MRKISLQELEDMFPIAYEFICNHDMENLPEQRYELGNHAYVNVESYKTYSFDDRKYESHIRYIDIQYIIIGRENIIVEPIEDLTVIEEYRLDRDIAFYSNSVKGVSNYLEAGDMLLLEPEDGHMPCVSIEGPIYVKKAVFKFPINY